MTDKDKPTPPFDTIRSLTGHESRLSVERLYCEAMGKDLAGGMFVSQLIFWSDKGNRTDGFVYRSAQEWENDTYLSTYLIRKYTKQCEDFGWLETKLMKANGSPTVHYRVETSRFSKWICEFLQMENEKFTNLLTDTTTYTTALSTEIEKSKSKPQPVDPRIVAEDPVQGPKATLHQRMEIDPRKIVEGLYPTGTGDTPYRVYREVFDYIPGRTVIAHMNETVGSDPAALQRWRETITAYALSGKESNWVKVQLDWFRDGIPANWDPTQKGNINANHRKPPTSGHTNGKTRQSNGLSRSVYDLPQSEQDRIQALLDGAHTAAPAAD